MAVLFSVWGYAVTVVEPVGVTTDTAAQTIAANDVGLAEGGQRTQTG